MTVRTKCDGCGKSVNAPDKFAGKTTNCPKCGGGLRFPTVESDADPFDDIIPVRDPDAVMPLEPAPEMQPVSYGDEAPVSSAFEDKQSQKFRPQNDGPVEISYPPDGMPVFIKRIKIPFADAVMLIITFWVATLVIMVALFTIGFFLMLMFGAGVSSLPR